MATLPTLGRVIHVRANPEGPWLAGICTQTIEKGGKALEFFAVGFKPTGELLVVQRLTIEHEGTLWRWPPRA